MAEYMHSYAFNREKSKDVDAYFGDGLALIGFALKLGIPLYYLRSCLLLLNMRQERIEQIMKPGIQIKEQLSENVISSIPKVSPSEITELSADTILKETQNCYCANDFCSHCGKPDKLYECANCGKPVCQNCLAEKPVNIVELMQPYRVYVVCQQCY